MACTIACDEGHITAHKDILCDHSKYLQDILSQHPTAEHPIIILTELNIMDIKILVNYMYTGELVITNDSSPTSLLRAAQILKIDSLTANDIDDDGVDVDADEDEDIADADRDQEDDLEGRASTTIRDQSPEDINQQQHSDQQQQHFRLINSIQNIYSLNQFITDTTTNSSSSSLSSSPPPQHQQQHQQLPLHHLHHHNHQQQPSLSSIGSTSLLSSNNTTITTSTSISGASSSSSTGGGGGGGGGGLNNAPGQLNFNNSNPKHNNSNLNFINNNNPNNTLSNHLQQHLSSHLDLEDLQDSKQQLDNKNNKIRCHLCNIGLSDVKCLYRHVLTRHLPEKWGYKCEFCDREFSRDDHLMRHYTTKHKNMEFNREKIRETRRLNREMAKNFHDQISTV